MTCPKSHSLRRVRLAPEFLLSHSAVEELLGEGETPQCSSGDSPLAYVVGPLLWACLELGLACAQTVPCLVLMSIDPAQPEKKNEEESEG